MICYTGLGAGAAAGSAAAVAAADDSEEYLVQLEGGQ